MQRFRPRSRRGWLFALAGVSFVLCMCLGLTVNAGRAVGLLPTVTPTSPPTITPTPGPTDTPRPTDAPAPTATARPTETPRPTADPAVAATREAGQLAREAERAFPCEPGQVKGNRNSLIYHAPGQRDYEDTRENVACFDTGAEAEAAGYRRAQR